MILLAQDNTVDIRGEFSKSGLKYPDISQPGGKAIGQLISTLLPLVLAFSAIALFVYILLAGFNWMTAGGDKNKVEDARNRITNGIIGLAIVASAYAIFRIVDRFFGIGLTN
jgi:hypothetical protein